MLKFICCSDTHNLVPPAIDETDVHAWLHAGDVFLNCRYEERPKPVEDAAKISAWADERKIPIYAVKGNHDCSMDTEFFDKINHASGRYIELSPGLGLFGLGWHGGAYYDLPTEYDMHKRCDEAKREWLLKSKSGDQYIVLTHYPPWVAALYPDARNPAGWMFQCIRELIDEIKPMVIIQGHVHELFGKQFVYSGPEFKSLIVAPGPKGGILSINLDESNATFEKWKKPKKEKE